MKHLSSSSANMSHSTFLNFTIPESSEMAGSWYETNYQTRRGSLAAFLVLQVLQSDFSIQGDIYTVCHCCLWLYFCGLIESSSGLCRLFDLWINSIPIM